MKKKLLTILTASFGLLSASLQAQTAQLQVIHNSADANAEFVDVYVGGQIFLDDFEFRTNTGFVNVPAGVPIAIAIAPENSSSVAEAFFNASPTFANNTKYVVVANGIRPTSTGYSPAQPFGLNVFNVGSTTGVTPGGQTGVLVVHGSTDAPSVDVGTASTGSYNTLIDNLAYGTSFQGNNNWGFLPNADYNLQVRTADGATAVAQYGAPLASLGLGGENVTVVASGFLNPSANNNGADFGLYVYGDQPGSGLALPSQTFSLSRLQVIHNSADAAAASVDVWVNNNLLPQLNNFQFRTATPFIDFPSSTNVGIRVKGDNSTDTIAPIFFQNVNVPTGTYVVVANGIVSQTGYNPSPDFGLDVFANARETASDPQEVDVLVYHGSTDAPTVDVKEVLVGAGTVVNDISYQGFQGYLELPYADYSLQIRNAAGTDVVAQFNAPLSALPVQGAALTVLASGFLNPGNNSTGPAFGLWAAGPAGGPLIQLPSTAVSTTRAQIIHNCADAAAATVDVWVNGTLLPELNNVDFRTATPFLDVPAGTPVSIAIQPANSNSPANPLFSATPTFLSTEKYIVVASGIISSNGYNPAPQFSLNIFNQAKEVADNANETNVLVYHGATDAPAVVVKETSTPVISNLLEDFTYTEFSGNVALPTADYQLQVAINGGSDAVAEYFAPLNTLGLDGASITVLASGFVTPGNNSNGPDFGLFAATPAGGPLLPLTTTSISTARVQLIHNSASPAANTVDIWVNGSEAIDDFQFRTATPFGDFKGGVGYDIEVRTPNGQTVVATFNDVTFNANEKYVVVASGNVGTGFEANPNGVSTAFTLLVEEGVRERSTNANQLQFIALHGATDAPAVDIIARGVSTLVDNAEYTNFTDYIGVPASNYLLDVTPASDNSTIVASFDAPLTTAAGASAVIFASGYLSPANDNNGPAFSICFALANGNVGCLENVTSVTENTIAVNTALFPNPANQVVNLQYTLTQASEMTVNVMDLTGRVMTSMNIGTQAMGNYSQELNIANYPAGIYTLQIVSGNAVTSKKLTVVR